jgi:hypothetical protein
MNYLILLGVGLAVSVLGVSIIFLIYGAVRRGKDNQIKSDANYIYRDWAYKKRR